MSRKFDRTHISFSPWQDPFKNPQPTYITAAAPAQPTYKRTLYPAPVFYHRGIEILDEPVQNEGMPVLDYPDGYSY
jgi:hypothetical protein